uniref:Uncharacterized protein n=1 Tax=Strongyloides stercoralis TaxID=6248 RepID=A0A0K0EAK8_STRER
MDKKLSDPIPGQLSPNNRIKNNESSKIEILSDKEMLEEQITQEEVEKCETTINEKVNDIESAKEGSKNSTSYYVMKTIEEPVNNETIGKTTNQPNKNGFWGFGVVSHYVMGGIKTIYPKISPISKAANQNNNEVSKVDTKSSSENAIDTNKQLKEEESNTFNKKVCNDNSKSVINELNRTTYGYLPNWDTLIGATSNIVETTTSVLKSATEVGIKNIKSLNQKVNRKTSTQNSYYSDVRLEQTDLKSAADYDYIDLVSLQSKLDENSSKNNKH